MSYGQVEESEETIRKIETICHNTRKKTGPPFGCTGSYVKHKTNILLKNIRNPCRNARAFRHTDSENPAWSFYRLGPGRVIGSVVLASSVKKATNSEVVLPTSA